jgi:hypothetical protein
MTNQIHVMSYSNLRRHLTSPVLKFSFPILILLLAVARADAQSAQVADPAAKDTLSLNLGDLAIIFQDAPLEGSGVDGDNPFIYNMPLPGNGTHPFLIQESPIMAPEFAAAFPTFKTYRAESVLNPAINGRITLTPHGFDVFIIFPTSLLTIRPLDLNNPEQHSVSFGELPDAAVHCDWDPSLDLVKEPPPPAKITFSNGGTKRNYTIAIVTTGEFHNANGGTVSSASASVVASVNAVQAVYERELAVVFTLLTPVIYTSPSTDPFFPGLNRVDKAAEVINSHFNVNNYDLGHVLHDQDQSPAELPGGGVAYIGAVCSNIPVGSSGFLKAGGWSGSFDNNSVEWTSLFAHELGHMFNMNHTWNGSGGSCTTSNISFTTSYEIASGTTIMSYKGICSASQNIPSSGGGDLYFHVNSLSSAINYMAGQTCHTGTSTGNSIPVVNANPCGTTLTIPKSTPFRLRGSGTDSDGDPIYYTWEQYNEDGSSNPTQGFIGSTAGASSLAPLFRSYPPGLNPVRTFPNMNLVVSNSYSSSFEPLPSVSRTLNFQLTGRDWKSGGGAVRGAETSVTVHSSGPFAVTAPNGGETIAAGSSTTVTWNVNSTDAICSNVNIKLSIDGGYNYPYTLASSTPNDGSQSITMPAGVANSASARVMVECADNTCAVFFDISNANFTVSSPCMTAGSNICPITPVSANSGSPSLALSMENYFGQALSTRQFDITSSDPFINVPSFNVAGTGCVWQGWSERHKTQPFTVTATGTYVFSISGNTSFPGLVIYEAAAFSSSGNCGGFVSSSYQALSNGSTNVYTSLTVNLTACTEYVLVATALNGTTPFSVTMSVAGPGDFLQNNTGPGAGYSYTYAAVNTTTGLVAAVSSTANFTSLGGGSYVVHGVSYYSGAGPSPTTVSPANWIGQSIEQITASGACALFSTNFRPVTVLCNPATVTAPTITHPPNCANPTGTIVVNASGSSSLEYSINNGSTWQSSNTFSSLSPGNYNISVRLAAEPNCVAVYSGNPVTINIPPGCCSPPVVNAPTVTQPTCSVQTGTIAVNATGIGTLEYSINNGSSWQSSATFSGLNAGTYQILVRYASEVSCTTAYASNPVVLTGATGCCTVPTYSVPCTSGDRIDDFTFGSFQNLNTGCANPGPTNLTNYQPLGPSAVPGSSYSVTIGAGSVSNFYAVYIDLNMDGDYTDAGEFFNIGGAIANGSVTSNVLIPSGTALGTSTLRVRSKFGSALTAADGCGTNLSWGETEDYNINFIACNAPIVNAPTLTQPSCAVTTGTIAVNATGSGSLEYSINGGSSFQSSATFSGLVPGNYNIVVRLAANPTCSASYSGNPVTINAAPTPPLVNAPTLTQPSCAVTTGTISVNAAGSSTLEYSINGGSSFQSSAAFSGLAPGNYNIVVRLAANPTCSASYSGNPVTINTAPTPPLVNAPTLTQPSCAVTTGTIAVNATGSGLLEYSINAGSSFQSSAAFSGLAPGNYNIVVRLAANPTCFTSYAGNPVTINAAPTPPVVDAPTLTQPSCAVTTGTIAVNATGSGLLEYSINAGSSFQSSAAFSGLVPGNYSIVVRLAANPTCSVSYSGNPVTINAAPTPPVVNAPTLTQPSCAVTTGTIAVNATGSGLLEYSINAGSSFQSSAAFSGLAPGNYNIVVRLAANPTCFTSYAGNPVTINAAPTPPVVDAPTLTQPSCAVTTGTIAVNATGSGLLEYSINAGSSFQSSAAFSGLVPGNYSIVVRLAANPTCSVSYSGNPVTINAAPTPPVVNAPTLTQPSCAVTTGTIAVNATGSGLLEYSINAGSSFQSSAAFSGLAPGNYNIVVRLAANPTCFTSYVGNPVSINAAPTPPVVDAPTLTQPSCAVTTGTIEVNATGGSGLLEYSINAGSSFQSSATFSGLVPGNYNIVVKLAANPTCITSYAGNPVLINAASQPQINSVLVTQPTCTEPSGTIEIFATGGGALEYSIDGGVNYQTNQLFGNLQPGAYEVRVRLQTDQTCIGIHPAQVILNAATGCCPTSLIIDETPIASGTYLASQSIISAGLVASGSSVEFKAGLSVDLLSGFEIATGAIFQVTMEGCEQGQ